VRVAELLSAGSRDSLLVAMTTLMWGSADAELVALLRRLVYDAMTQSQQVTDILILKLILVIVFILFSKFCFYLFLYF